MNGGEIKQLLLFRHKCIKYKVCQKVKDYHTLLLTTLVRVSIMVSMRAAYDNTRRAQVVRCLCEGNSASVPRCA